MRSAFTLALVLSAFSITAQQDVVFQIDHFLGSEPFSTSTVASNNNGEAFDVGRLEYYISEITLIHDGGQVTMVPTTWVLANAMTTTTVPLGSFDITDLEAVEFGIGVNEAVNHLDPAQYPANHPLAPKSPSMHWGWAPGYRFIAMEGGSGAGMNQNYEIHALGDDNYYKQTIPTAGVVDGNTLTVKLIADYEEALRDISVSSGPIIHGETGIAVDLIENFKMNVFTSVEGNGPVGIGEVQMAQMVIYPNPTDGNARVELRDHFGVDELIVHDATGRQVQRIPVRNMDIVDVALMDAGVYQLSLMQDGHLIATRSLVRR